MLLAEVNWQENRKINFKIGKFGFKMVIFPLNISIKIYMVVVQFYGRVWAKKIFALKDSVNEFSHAQNFIGNLQMNLHWFSDFWKCTVSVIVDLNAKCLGLADSANFLSLQN